MTEKELLYVEDALEHIKMLHKKCIRYENMIKDHNLKQAIYEIKAKQEVLYEKLYELL